MTAKRKKPLVDKANIVRDDLAGDDAGKRRLRSAEGVLHGLVCWPEVEMRLLAGVPLMEVARFIQQECREAAQYTCSTLESYLRSQRQALLPEGQVRQGHRVAAEKEFGDRLAQLRRLERLYQDLEFRWDLVHGAERVSGAINPDADRMVKDLVAVVAKQHEIVMDLGLFGSRDLGTMMVSPERLEELRQRYGEGAAQAYADPVSRGRIAAVLRAAMTAARLEGAPAEAVVGVQDGALGLPLPDEGAQA